jgi:hypothetical protein
MEIVWTATANFTFRKEQDFIFTKWNRIEVIKFLDLVDIIIIIIEKLQNFPKIGTLKNNRSHFVISKQTTLIYKIVSPEKIEILLFWNNKWSPKDFDKILNQK